MPSPSSASRWTIGGRARNQGMLAAGAAAASEAACWPAAPGPNAVSSRASARSAMARRISSPGPNTVAATLATTGPAGMSQTSIATPIGADERFASPVTRRRRGLTVRHQHEACVVGLREGRLGRQEVGEGSLRGREQHPLVEHDTQLL